MVPPKQYDDNDTHANSQLDKQMKHIIYYVNE